MNKASMFPILLFCAFLSFCSAENESASVEQLPAVNNEPPEMEAFTHKYLALGDSYTKGESVCSTCSFPIQLKDSLQKHIAGSNIDLKIIAQTGWTTSNLKASITAQNPSNDYDLVTLLIGVNNQYQHKPFSLYEQEFPELVNKAIAFAKGDKANVIVVSIPDYFYTPYAQSLSGMQNVSAEIDQYNSFAENYCVQNDIEFVNITDITRQGLANPQLVTYDGLHPSELAYSQFVSRILPLAVLAISE